MYKQDSTEFYDRYKELRDLKQKYDFLKRGELCVLYGRRRLGKTKLVLKFLNYVKNNKLYCYVPITSEKGAMKQFSNDIKESCNDDVNINDWNSFFDYISSKSKENPFVLIIDEFQRFQDSSKEFISLLQKNWDSNLKNNKLMLIVLGSSIGMMSDLFLNSKGALYGRATYIKRLKPFRFIDFREMFKELSFENQIYFYSVFGGTPYYLELVKNLNKNLFDSIFKLCIEEGGPLVDEPVNALSFELKNPGKYNSLLLSISEGHKELRELTNIFGEERTQIFPYLNVLQNLLDLIEKEEVLLTKSNRSRYDFSDNFFKFWYRFIFSQKRMIELNNREEVMSKIKKELEGFVGRIFEKIIKELLILFNGKKIKNLNLKFIQMGSWWDDKDEIDIILQDKNLIYVCDVKWSNREITVNYIKDLIEKKSKKLNFSGQLKYLFFYRGKLDPEAEEYCKNNKVLCLSINDVEDLFNSVGNEEKKNQRMLADYF